MQKKLGALYDKGFSRHNVFRRNTLSCRPALRIPGNIRIFGIPQKRERAVYHYLALVGFMFAVYSPAVKSDV